MTSAFPPLIGANFIVDLGDGATPTGFAEVIFPRFAVAPDLTEPPLLQLRRAATGQLDLYAWWNTMRHDPKRALRTVTIELLSADFRRPVMRWRFVKARPVSLGYGALDANQPAMVSETLILSYEDIEMAVPAAPRRQGRLPAG